MNKKDCIRRILFFAAVLALMLCVAVGAAAEGTDPCHDSLRAAPYGTGEEEEEESSPLNLSWAGSDVVKGFIYGEILNRKRA